MLQTSEAPFFSCVKTPPPPTFPEGTQVKQTGLCSLTGRVLFNNLWYRKTMFPENTKGGSKCRASAGYPVRKDWCALRVKTNPPVKILKKPKIQNPKELHSC